MAGEDLLIRIRVPFGLLGRVNRPAADDGKTTSRRTREALHLALGPAGAVGSP